MQVSRNQGYLQESSRSSLQISTDKEQSKALIIRALDHCDSGDSKRFIRYTIRSIFIWSPCQTIDTSLRQYPDAFLFRTLECRCARTLLRAARDLKEVNIKLLKNSWYRETLYKNRTTGARTVMGRVLEACSCARHIHSRATRPASPCALLGDEKQASMHCADT